MGQAVAEKKSGFRWIKVLGIITVVGLIAAIARIVLRVFREESHRAEEAQSGTDSQSGV
jgi:flagellar basal body-associated protein FliL